MKNEEKGEEGKGKEWTWEEEYEVKNVAIWQMKHEWMNKWEMIEWIK